MCGLNMTQSEGILEETPGFRSLVYRFGFIYNFVNNLLYDWERRFATLAKFVGHAEANEPPLKILDLACGTGYLARFLHPSVDYEGWDLNLSFLKQLEKDWKKGKIRVGKLTVKWKNILDFDSYPKKKKDVIVLCDILHHIHPRDVEVVEYAKNFANKIVICEPSAIKPKDIEAHDWTAKAIMFFMKNFPESLYKMVDFFLADNDGINSYERRSAWKYNENGLKKFFSSLGIRKFYRLKDECIGIWELEV
jgi:SAM-dependent methyltransferase